MSLPTSPAWPQRKRHPYTARDPLSLEGLVIAGVVIDALGVLDDVAVSQASPVLALRRANPALRARELFAAAMAVGRDHVEATVNTLVLAYVGAALPALLIFADQGTNLGNAVNREPVAATILAALVGPLGLLAAVPLCTAVAALLATRVDAGALDDRAHGPAHWATYGVGPRSPAASTPPTTSRPVSARLAPRPSRPPSHTRRPVAPPTAASAPVAPAAH